MIKISDFQVKDVVNMSNGKKLGHIADLEINLNTGKIEALIIPGPGKMLGFSQGRATLSFLGEIS